MSEAAGASQDGAPSGWRFAGVLVLVGAAGLLLDLTMLLLLPLRLRGVQAPVALVLVLVGNAALGALAGRWLRSQGPAIILVGLALALSLAGASSGPGGDLIITRDLQLLYLGYIVAATLGAALPLLQARRQPAAPRSP